MAEFNGNDMNTSGMSTTVTAVSKKKGHIGLFIGLGVLLLLAACFLVFLFVPVVNNFVKMNVMKPEKYYSSVEKEYMKTVAADVSDEYQTVLDTVDNKDGTTVDYSVKVEAGDALKTMLQDSLADSGMSITLDSAEISGTAAMKDDKMSGNYSMKVNDTDISSVDVLIDMATMEMYAKVPEMFDGWIFSNMSDAADLVEDDYMYEDYMDDDSALVDAEDDLSNMSLDNISDVLTADELEELITRYSDIVLAQLEDVEIEKSEDVEAAGVESTYAVTTTTISEKDMYSICKDVLDEAKGDDVLIDAVVELGIYADEDEFVTACEDAISDLDSSIETADKSNYVELLTYIDAEGNVRGRKLIPYSNGEEEENFSCYYLMVKDGKEVGIDAEIMSDEEGFKMSVNAEEGDKDVYSGKADMTLATTTYDNETYESVPVEYTATVDIKDYQVVNEDKGYTNGTFTISKMDIEGVDLTGTSLKLESDGDNQSVALDVTYNGENYGAITISASQKDNADEITMPSDSDTIYDLSDEADLTAFSSAMNYETVVQTLGTAIGLDQETIDSLMQYYVSGSTGYDDDYDDYYDDYDDYDDGETETTDTDTSDGVTMDFSKVAVTVNGQTTNFPVIIPGISTMLGEDSSSVIEAGGWDSFSTADLYVRFDNPLTDTALTLDQCPIELITMYSANSPVKLTLNGITVGSTYDQVMAAFPELQATATDSSYGYFTIYDTASEWNEIEITVSDGKVDSIELDLMDYDDAAATAMAKANLAATGAAAAVVQ